MASVVALVCAVAACAEERSSMSESARSADASITAAAEARQACRDTSARAVSLIRDAAMSVEQCSTDADCKVVVVEATCWDSCATLGIAGNEATHRAVDDVKDEVADTCKDFAAAGCKVIASGCPPLGTGFVCRQGRCLRQIP